MSLFVFHKKFECFSTLFVLVNCHLSRVLQISGIDRIRDFAQPKKTKTNKKTIMRNTSKINM